ncbi:MAG: hypothetical protein LBT10_06855 [Methanobrevibacter sp.]|jgi:hypothetical protein|nr:hypothetical protein [Methanobrevibacter sp.]
MNRNLIKYEEILGYLYQLLETINYINRRRSGYDFYDINQIETTYNYLKDSSTKSELLDYCDYYHSYIINLINDPLENYEVGEYETINKWVESKIISSELLKRIMEVQKDEC